MRTVMLALTCSMLGVPALAQEFRRLLPTSPTHDTNWYTGVNDLTPDGRFLAGFQGAAATTQGGAIWDMASASTRPVITTSNWGVNGLSHDTLRYYGHTPPPNSQGWNCRPGACFPLASLLSLWAGSGDGLVTGGNARIGLGEEPRPAVYSTAMDLRMMDSPAITLDIGFSDDGTIAYFLAFIELDAFLFRWDLRTGGQPTMLRPERAQSERLASVSADGSVAYFSIEGGLQRYTHGVGFEDILGTGPGAITSISPDGRRAAGVYRDGSSAGFIWDPFSGVTFLDTIVPGIDRIAAAVRISDDGMCVAGATRAANNMAYGFWLRLPDSFNQLQGDYSRDGSENQDDIYEYVNYFAGAPNPYNLPLDYNRDGEVNTTDAFDLVNCIAGGCP
jgi:hypothetical protein